MLAHVHARLEAGPASVDETLSLLSLLGRIHKELWRRASDPEAGAAALQATRGQGGNHFVILALAAALWIVAGWAARRWWKAREQKNAED